MTTSHPEQVFPYEQALARFDPCIPDGDLWVAPTFPDALGKISIDRLPLAGARVSIELSGNQVQVSGLPAGITVHESPRPLSHESIELREA